MFCVAIFAAAVAATLSQVDDVVLILRTGKAVINDRLGPLLEQESHLRHFRNLLLVNDAPSSRWPVYDAFDNMSFVKSARERVLAQPTLFADYLARTPPTKLSKRVFGSGNAEWHIDKYKFLVSFRRAFEMFPNATWFFMIDDDTYVSARNLASVLAKRHDPVNGIYAGNVMGCNCCDAGRTPRYKQMLFAHGGSGILLSRNALARMQPVMDACIYRWSECWAGDIQVAACLLGLEPPLKIEPLGGTHSEPPAHTLTKTHGRWCEETLTFHHLLTRQVLSLYQTEEAAWRNETRFSLGLLVQPFFLAPMLANHSIADTPEIVCVAGHTNQGDNLQVIANGPGKQVECEALCKQNGECVAFVKAPKSCILKRNLDAHLQPAANNTFCLIKSRTQNRFHC